MTHKAQIGSISSGTLRDADLAEAFCEELAAQRKLSAATCNYPEVRRAYYAGTLDKLADRDDCILSAWINEDAMDALNETAPEYCYFGAHYGDGADFGYWIDYDQIRDDQRYGELPSGDELPEHNRGAFLVVNDHGNMTLYHGHTEVWAIV